MITTTALTNGLMIPVASAEVELGLAAGVEPRVARWVQAASSLILAACNPTRLSLRESVIETVPGSGTNLLLLERGPVAWADLVSVAEQGTAVGLADLSVDEEICGIYREAGWASRRPAVAPGVDPPLAAFALRDVVITYRAGFWPDLQTIGSLTGCSSSLASPVITKATHGLVVVAGDRVDVTASTIPGDVGTYTVVSSTADTITLDRALTGTSAAVALTAYHGKTLPPVVEEAVGVVLRARFSALTLNPTVKSETVGKLSVTYRDTADISGLPADALALLRGFVW